MEADESGPPVTRAAPRPVAPPGAGPGTGGRRGRHPGRLRSEAALAHLRGAGPVPASSGRADRHRLDRGGDNALRTVVPVPTGHDRRTRDHAARPT
ncbi:transposase [Streptomyces sp. enrichment culture]|uniref:transposase n=1 Tax=Streptomyces sp. enrichment culture TaxID=1795815 RepID=UPI003F57B604